MSFLYLNTGYTSMFDDSTFTEEQFVMSNPLNKVAISDGQGIVKLPDSIDELCFKLHIYSELDYISGLTISLGASGTNKKFTVGFEGDNFFYRCNDLMYHTVSYTKAYKEAYSTNTLWVYVIPSSNGDSGALQVVFNNTILFDINDSDISFPDNPVITVLSNNSYLHLSNFIIADQQFDYLCEVVTCPTIIDTEMELDGVNYVASDAGQLLINILNVANLITQFTKKSQVYGMSLVNIYESESPSYATLADVEKRNSSYKENNSYCIESESGYIQSSKFLSNMTLNNMKNRVYGWLFKG